MAKSYRTPQKAPNKAFKTGSSDKLTLLGGGPLQQLSSPDEAVLETFPNPSERDYEVIFSTRSEERRVGKECRL